MMMIRLKTALLLVTLPCLIMVTEGQGRMESRRRKTGGGGGYGECVLFKANDSYAMRHSSSYLELGYYDIEAGRDFEISFRVFPDKENHNGPIFSIGTPEFEYYEWKTKAVKTQFLVVEFVYSALAALLKALGQEHMTQLEIYKTFPEPYEIDDSEWHSVSVKRVTQDYSRPNEQSWFIQIDNLTANQTNTAKTNISILDRPAYLGGRPGYKSSQFKGVLRDLFINGERVQLRGKATYGLTEVWHCSAPEVSKFIEELKMAGRRPTPPTRSWRKMRDRMRNNRNRQSPSTADMDYIDEPWEDDQNNQGGADGAAYWG